MESFDQSGTVQLTADIVSAFVTSNKVTSEQLTRLIADVHLALVRAPAAAAVPEQKPLVPAVPIKKSITPDYIICLEDGSKFKSLKRHLSGHYNMTPDEYRAKWGLPRDYPMVAPNYAKARSELAKSMGLGRKSGSAAPTKKAAKPRKRAAPPHLPLPAISSLGGFRTPALSLPVRGAARHRPASENLHNSGRADSVSPTLQDNQ